MYVNVSESRNSTNIDIYAGLSILDRKRLLHPRWIHTIVGLILICIGFFGFWENILVLYTFIKTKSLRSATNIFIMGLAISDLCMVCLGNPLASTSALNGGWFAGEFFCYWEGFIVYTFGMAELYILTAISFDRYIVIARPLKAHMITKRVATLSVIACFLFGALWAIFPFMGWSSYGLEAPGVFCGLHWEDRSISNTTYTVTITFFCFLFPIAIMIYSYYGVYMTVRSANKNMVWDMKSRVAKRNLKIERKMFKSCVIMCSVYWLCWFPYTLVSLWQTFGDADAIPLALTEIPAVAAKSEVVWNPIIYVATNKQFRRAFYASLPCTRIRDILVKREELQEQESKESDLEDDTNKAGNTSNTMTVHNAASESAAPNVVIPTVQGLP